MDVRGKRPLGTILAWLRLARVFHKIDRIETEHLSCWGLSPAQFDVLAHVGAAEGIIQQDLADSLLVSKGNVCQLLDRLERSGLLLRRPEGRINRLYLTDAGRALFDAVVPAHEDRIAAQFASLTPIEQRQLRDLLRRLDHAIPE